MRIYFLKNYIFVVLNFSCRYKEGNIMKRIAKYILVCVLCMVYGTVFPDPIFRNLNTSDGLKDMVISALYKDVEGYVWIGTGSSVERFDGVRLKHYDIPDRGSKTKRVNALAEVPGHDLWMGNYQGLWRLNRKEDRWKPFRSDVIAGKVNTLLKLAGDTLLAGTEKGLFFIADDSVKHVYVEGNDVFSENEVLAAAWAGEGGNFWFTTPKGLYRFDAGSRKVVVIGRRQEGEVYHSMAMVHDKIFLGTSDKGIVEYDVRTATFTRFVDVGSNVISSLSTDGNDLLYVSTDGYGIHFISVSGRKVVKSILHKAGDARGLSSNAVYTLLVDRDGLIWAGLFQAGLDYSLHQDSVFTTYRFSSLFDSWNKLVRTFSMHGEEKLIGTNEGVYYVNEKKSVVKHFSQPELRADLILSSCYYQGRFYFGTFGGGVYVFDSATMSLSDFDSSRSSAFLYGQVFCIVPDREGRLWIGTSSGIYCYEGNKCVAHYDAMTSRLPGNIVYGIFFDSLGRGWIGTNKGLALWESSQKAIFTDVLPESSLKEGQMIRTVYEDTEGNLYIVPTESAVCVVDRMLREVFALENEGLFSECMAIAEDNDGRLWLATNKGIHCYRKGKRMRSFDLADGVPSPLFTACVPVKDNEGNLWFGNSKGLLKWNGRTETGDDFLYPLQITGISINQDALRNPDKQSDSLFVVSLAENERNVTICFSDFSYSPVESFDYEYRLDGSDEEWNRLTGKSSVSYYDLPRGVHRFVVRRAGDALSEVTLVLRVASSWNVVGWLLGILIVGGIAIAGYIFLRRKEKSVPENNIETPKDKYKASKLTDEECKALEEKLRQTMLEQKPYTNQNLNMTDLARLVGISVHNLSYLFNQYLNCKYSDYVNNYRVKEFQRILEEEEGESRYTIMGLAERCGFNSKASFFRNFKRVTGVTPNEFLKSLRKKQQ